MSRPPVEEGLGGEEAFHLSAYDYELPPGRIAVRPARPRDSARLLVLERGPGRLAHHRFREIGRFLRAGDLLVLNDTAVLPARLLGRKQTGGRVEVLLLDPLGGERSADGRRWCGPCLVRSAKPARPGTELAFGGGLRGRVLEGSGGACRVALEADEELFAVLERVGRVPLPPYLGRPDDDADRTDYQTVYAAHAGAVAAPTAGLHFTPELLASLGACGVESAFLTLHVGWGTFQPVRESDVRRHRLHDEGYRLPPETAAAVDRARAKGGRVIAVGTTVARVLEFAADGRGGVRPGSGRCDLFILPGHRFRVLDGLVTNFHLPRSSLLLLVSAFAGRERVLAAYRTAVREGYRFYSYGDAMLIL
ncbi:MAG: tRNA preQ1(34) S-adenosylmethionine ribosyltransferase-isomerase QueA [Desulfobacterales bacterium]